MTSKQKKTVGICGVVGTWILVVLVLVIARSLFWDATSELAAALKASALCSGITSMVACLLCHLVDPGSPRPDASDPRPQDERDESQRIRPRRELDGQTWDQKWCLTCELWRPYRCGHCHMCERCVLRLDHHCGFMGTCIGERNARFFAAFLLSAGIGLSLLAVLAVYHLTVLGCWTSGVAWLQSWQPAAIVIFFCCCPPIPLCFLAQSVALTGAGIWSTGTMLADTDCRQYQGGFGISSAVAACCHELMNLVSCRGARVYCLSPMSIKRYTCTARQRGGLL